MIYLSNQGLKRKKKASSQLQFGPAPGPEITYPAPDPLCPQPAPSHPHPRNRDTRRVPPLSALLPPRSPPPPPGDMGYTKDQLLSRLQVGTTTSAAALSLLSLSCSLSQPFLWYLGRVASWPSRSARLRSWMLLCSLLYDHEMLILGLVLLGGDFLLFCRRVGFSYTVALKMRL